jgi:hypothetical protein
MMLFPAMGAPTPEEQALCAALIAVMESHSATSPTHDAVLRPAVMALASLTATIISEKSLLADGVDVFTAFVGDLLHQAIRNLLEAGDRGEDVDA